MPIDPKAPSTAYAWSDTVPEGCPFAKSERITGMAFTGRHAEYTVSDTWYPSWTADGNLYSPYMDGHVPDTNGRPKWHFESGVAVVRGDDPLQLSVEAIDVSEEPSEKPFVFRGRSATGDYVRAVSGDGNDRNCGPLIIDHNAYTGVYATASLVHRGIWYLGPELRDPPRAVGPDGNRYDWPHSGPFWGFRLSRDMGRTWEDADVPLGNSSLFPEPAYHHGPVKFGVPHFVDFGQEMRHSPDGLAYLVSHGVSQDPMPRFNHSAWNMGDEVFLARVAPTPADINRRDAYEFFAGQDASGAALWSPNFDDLRPLFAWPGRTGCATITYNAPLKTYLMCVGDGWWPGKGPSSTYVLESDSLTGSWRLVTYMRNFGPQCYFANFPSKFISADGRTAWLCYSANYAGWEAGGAPCPPGSGYAMCLQEVRLL